MLQGSLKQRSCLEEIWVFFLQHDFSSKLELRNFMYLLQSFSNCIGETSRLAKETTLYYYVIRPIFNIDPFIRYSFQNRFLNKEVLELNQLRTQAVDREQKLFIEASDWEAKFYQIQSKYLLLLNELHNPQASQTS